MSTTQRADLGAPAEATPPRPPFNPDLQVFLDMVTGLVPPIGAETLPMLRAGEAAAVAETLVRLESLEGVRVSHAFAPATAGEPDVPLLVLAPRDPEGPTPLLFLIHGGGMVAGHHVTGADGFAPLVRELGVTLVSVGYRLAPEHPHPAPVEDCYRGLAWVVEEADALGVDRERVVVMGVSAGGGLAAGVSLMSRDRGFPRISRQVLVCPMLDDRCASPSARMLVGEGMWDRDANEFGWDSLLGPARGTDDVSPYAAPARAEDLSGLPPTYLDCGSVETFRDEVLDFAQRLSAAGVSVDLHMWGGGFHAFDHFVPDAPISRAAASVRNAYLAGAFGPSR